MHFVGTSNIFSACFGQSQVSNFTFLDKIGDGTNCFLNRDVGVDATRLVNVYDIYAESLKRVGREVLHGVWSSINTQHLSGGRTKGTKFYADKRLIPTTFDRLTHEKLIVSHSVKVTRVQKIDACF
jgi:hypothetical protein